MEDQKMGEEHVIAELEAADLHDARRRDLLSELRQVGTEQSLGVLRANLQVSDAKSQVRAVFALARIGTDDAVDALSDCLALETGPRFTFAVKALAELRATRAIPALIHTLETRSGELGEGDRRMVIFAFSEMPHRSEVPMLSVALRRGNRRTRKMAAMTLMSIRATESGEALEEAAQSLSWLRGLAARRALRSQRNANGE